MKSKVKTEIMLFGIYVLAGLLVGVIYAVLSRIGVINPPEGEGSKLWGALVIGVIGVVIFFGATIVYELLKKRNKNIEVEDKDERNLAIQGKAGFQAWSVNIAALTGAGIFLYMLGYSNSYLILIAGLLAFNIISFIALNVYYNYKM